MPDKKDGENTRYHYPVLAGKTFCIAGLSATLLSMIAVSLTHAKNLSRNLSSDKNYRYIRAALSGAVRCERGASLSFGLLAGSTFSALVPAYAVISNPRAFGLSSVLERSWNNPLISAPFGFAGVGFFILHSALVYKLQKAPIFSRYTTGFGGAGILAFVIFPLYMAVFAGVIAPAVSALQQSPHGIFKTKCNLQTSEIAEQKSAP